MKQAAKMAITASASWLIGCSAYAQSPAIDGNWRTPTGSVIDVYSCGDTVCLRIVQVEKSAAGTVDANNPDPALRSRSLCGLRVGSGFHAVNGGQGAEDGQLYDPTNGKTYTGMLAAVGSDRLRLRGYVGIKLFGRTEEWTRVTEAVPPCH